MTSSSVEWALTELLRHPEAMDKVKIEISIVGPNRKSEESDIDSFPYMQALIKESLHLHPPAPFLIPRETIHHTKFMVYNIPKGTQFLVNSWAIGRDPECWDDPISFLPERFLGSKVDVKGQHYELNSICCWKKDMRCLAFRPSHDVFCSGIVASRIRMGAS
ncbi:hypothetical protein FXO38_25848 [Capsicum annuum]|nr:hypothetical protein FXO38_25848 [Capsicum annuum]KAF3666228.1 hypothetical protein FXO37_10669 [Capsicum annuum]